MSSALRTRSAFAPPPMSRKHGGLTTVLLDEVERVHRQSGTVADAADVAVEMHVRQSAPPRLDLEWIVAGPTVVAGLVLGELLGDVGMPVVRVLIDLELAVGGDERTVRGEHQWIDLAGERIE